MITNKMLTRIGVKKEKDLRAQYWLVAGKYHQTLLVKFYRMQFREAGMIQVH